MRNYSSKKISPVIIMAEDDNVAIVKREIKKGTVVFCRNKKIKIKNIIRKGERFALYDIVKDGLIFQYGCPFGLSKGIKAGELISKNNVGVYRDDYVNIENAVGRIFKSKKILSIGRRNDNRMESLTFMGYKRRTGQIGTRNYYLIVPTSLCAADTAVKIAALIKDDELKKNYKNIDGIIAIPHTEGCGTNDGGIIERVKLTLKNTINNPNIGGVLIVDMGCEKISCKELLRYFRKSESCKPIDCLSIQDVGGTRKVLLQSKKIIYRRLKEIDSIKRQKISIKHLVVGTECGGSDSFSGITANPVMGLAVDRIINAGGSAILSEIPEIMGVEISLIKRMSSKKVAKKFLNGINYYRSLAKRLDVSMDGNIGRGNEDGGLINLTLKSLGAVLKGGSTNIVDFIDYSEQIKHRGLSVMNGPGNDLESMTGMVASGANIILFSTGRGSTEGNSIVPVIKISTTTQLYKKMDEDMDFNAGSLLDEKVSSDEISSRLVDMIVKVASGEKTWSEILEKRSFQIWNAGKLSL